MTPEGIFQPGDCIWSRNAFKRLPVLTGLQCALIKRFRFYRNLLSESFIVFRISVLSLLLKDSEFFGIFYCFFNFGTILIFILFISGRALWQAKSPKPYHIQPPKSTHIWTLIRRCAVRVSVSIQITILDLEPNPCFQTLLIISKTYHQIFNCNTSKCRSGQELLFIFFQLRALTCLWGRYDPKTENFTYFYIYLLHIHSLSRTFYVRV